MACAFKRLLSQPNNKQSCIRDVVSMSFFTWSCNTVINPHIDSLDVKFYWCTTTRLVDRVLGRCWRL